MSWEVLKHPEIHKALMKLEKQEIKFNQQLKQYNQYHWTPSNHLHRSNYFAKVFFIQKS